MTKVSPIDEPPSQKIVWPTMCAVPGESSGTTGATKSDVSPGEKDRLLKKVGQSQIEVDCSKKLFLE